MSMSEPTPTLCVAVLMGGPSAEAEVSRNSAAQVAQALADRSHTAELIELNPSCIDALQQLQPDVVFPALHGPPGEDGTVQGFLEIVGLPYVGSGVHGSAMAMDKAAAKHLFRSAGLPVTADLVVAPDADIPQTIAAIHHKLGQQVVVKPQNQGSAIGVQLLPNGGDLLPALTEALNYGPVLVEPYVFGKEITVGVLDTAEGTIAHPVIEIITATGEWYDYTNRYAAGKSEHRIPADLPSPVQHTLQQIAIRAL